MVALSTAWPPLDLEAAALLRCVMLLNQAVMAGFAYAAASPPAGAVDRGVRIAARTR